jgi:hypothetical protein
MNDETTAPQSVSKSRRPYLVTAAGIMLILSGCLGVVLSMRRIAQRLALSLQLFLPLASLPFNAGEVAGYGPVPLLGY